MSAFPDPARIIAMTVSYGFCGLLFISVVWGLIASTVALAGQIKLTYRRYWPRKTKVPVVSPRFHSDRSAERVFPALWSFRGPSPDRATKPKERLRAH